LEYTTDPELIAEKFKNEVDLVIDGGMGNLYASTVVNLSEGEVEIVREGRGDISLL
jgi:tRNA A37 threonylcarbamoyladenosine synthetase subunit TsaC/SUA5/YrdC